jgi:hypothetical protein
MLALLSMQKRKKTPPWSPCFIESAFVGNVGSPSKMHFRYFRQFTLSTEVSQLLAALLPFAEMPLT